MPCEDAQASPRHAKVRASTVPRSDFAQGTTAPQHPRLETQRLFAADAGSDKLAPLRTDDLLINRLLQTVEARLRHAELHLILPLLALHGLRRGAAGVALAR